MVLPTRGLTRRGKGCFQGEVTVPGKEGIGPTLMIHAPAATGVARSLAENTPQAAANPTVHVRERCVVTVLKVTEPTPQRPVDVRNNALQGTTVRPLRFRTQRVFELVQAFLPRPVRQVAPTRGLKVIAKKVKTA